MGFLSDDFDASTATAGTGLHDVHVLVIIEFPVDAPPFVVFGEEVGLGANVKFRAVGPPHSENIPP